MPKYDTILFDLDGTVADTDEMLRVTFKILYDKYRNGIETPPEQVVYFSGPPIYDTLKKEFPHQDQDFMFKKFHEVSTSVYKDTVKAFPDAKEVLLNLKKHGYKLGVVTNKVHKSSIYCLKLIDLEGIFDVIIGYDDVSKGKPDKEGMLKAMELLKASSLQSTLYVGDNKIDLDSATNAGIDCALVYWGPRVLPDSLKPALKIHSFKELERILINE